MTASLPVKLLGATLVLVALSVLWGLYQNPLLQLYLADLRWC